MNSGSKQNGLLRDLASRPGARQFLQFAAVGAAATLVQYLVLVCLIEGLGGEPIPSAVFAYISGAFVSYGLNARFTFGKTKTAFGKGLIKFLVVNVIGLALNTLIFSVLVKAHFHYITAQLIATALVLFWNYAGARLYVFRG